MGVEVGTEGAGGADVGSGTTSAGWEAVGLGSEAKAGGGGCVGSNSGVYVAVGPAGRTTTVITNVKLARWLLLSVTLNRNRCGPLSGRVGTAGDG